MTQMFGEMSVNVPADGVFSFIGMENDGGLCGEIDQEEQDNRTGKGFLHGLLLFCPSKIQIHRKSTGLYGVNFTLNSVDLPFNRALSLG